MEKVRLNKFLAERLGLSRRQADDAIAAGKVLVNEKPAIWARVLTKMIKCATMELYSPLMWAIFMWA